MSALHAFVLCLIIIMLALVVVAVLDSLRRTKLHGPLNGARPPLALSFVSLETYPSEVVLEVQDEHRNMYTFKKFLDDPVWVHWPSGEPAGQLWQLDAARVSNALDRLLIEGKDETQSN